MEELRDMHNFLNIKSDSSTDTDNDSPFLKKSPTTKIPDFKSPEIGNMFLNSMTNNRKPLSTNMFSISSSDERPCPLYKNSISSVKIKHNPDAVLKNLSRESKIQFSNINRESVNISSGVDISGDKNKLKINNSRNKLKINNSQNKSEINTSSPLKFGKKKIDANLVKDDIKCELPKIKTNLIKPRLYSKATHLTLDGEKPDYDAMSEEEQEELFDEYDHRFNIIIKNHPDFDIKKPELPCTLSKFINSFEIQNKMIEIKMQSGNWSSCLELFYKAVEYVLVKLFKFKMMEGFAKHQIESMKYYNQTLLELGEAYAVVEDPRDTPISKLMKIIGLKTAIFIIAAIVNSKCSLIPKSVATKAMDAMVNKTGVSGVMDVAKSMADGNYAKAATDIIGHENPGKIGTVKKTTLDDVTLKAKGSNPECIKPKNINLGSFI